MTSSQTTSTADARHRSRLETYETTPPSAPLRPAPSFNSPDGAGSAGNDPAWRGL